MCLRLNKIGFNCLFEALINDTYARLIELYGKGTCVKISKL